MNPSTSEKDVEVYASNQRTAIFRSCTTRTDVCYFEILNEFPTLFLENIHGMYNPPDASMWDKENKTYCHQQSAKVKYKSIILVRMDD